MIERIFPLAVIACGLNTAAAVDPVVDFAVEFNRDVRPILSNSCYSCHGPDENTREADLRLDSRAGALAELDSGTGRAIVPGDVDASELWRRVTVADDGERMPPGRDALSPTQLAVLRKWIEQGAQWQPHWSFVPPRRAKLPVTKDTEWPLGAIDQFILARLESEQLTPSEPAGRVTLIRRLSFDLLGLPPSAADVERFINDTRPDAYPGLVDRLLASPHFGERLAAYWLDLVRYADTVGYHGDQDHNISPYRDYVINALNRNLPFDQFTTEQLAGDLLPGASKWQKVASGYNRLLQTTHEGGAQDKEYLAKYAADRVRTTSSVWMGATMGCCECHDHKFDPYTLRDFYSFAAFFADVREQGAFSAPNSLPTTRAPEIPVLDPIDEHQASLLDAELRAVEERLANQPENAEQIKQDMNEIKRRREQVQKRARLTMVTESVEAREMRVLSRGDWMDTSGARALPAIPEFMGRLDVGIGQATRLDLARWLTNASHPQTARVMVNRLWQLYFGTGISRATEDLGSQGEWPVHPELLDWLAVEFVDSGWDLKHIVRLIVTSRTYQQSSHESDELQQRDPENRLLARQSRFRLDAEMIRDNALAVSGLLVENLGGRSVRPYQPAGYYAHLNFPEREYQHDAHDGQYRRGVYMHWQRQFLHPMLKAFDAPSREECTARRPRSNTPLAALTMLNDPSFVEAARVFAQRILHDHADSERGNTDSARLTSAYRDLFSREPSSREEKLLLSLLNGHRTEYRADKQAAGELVTVGLTPVSGDLNVVELAAWTSVTRTLLNLNEAIMRN
jgi:mono/diheme cytochrome c family protein